MQTISARSEGRLNRIQWEADGGIRLDLLGFVRFPEGYRGVLHSHPFWELIFIGAGTGVLDYGLSSLACGAGDILLIPPGEKHLFQADALKPFDQMYVGFSFDFALPEALAETPPRALPSGPFADLIRSELRENLEFLKDKSGSSLEAIRGRLLAVVSRVIGFLASPEGRAPAPYRGRYGSTVTLATEFLRTDLKGNAGVPDLARRFCLSPQYFGEIFKRDTGTSVKEFQRNCRMEKAMLLLQQGNLTVTEVASEVGMEDLAYFSRVFKKRYGIPPRQARRG